MRKVLTIGTFDTPHLGHAYLFKQCELYGDKVIVGVNSDEFVEKYKGKPPLFHESERFTMVSSLGYEVILNESAGRDLIVTVWPHVLVIGGDWARKDYYAQIGVNQDFMDDYGITMVYVPRVPVYSSTEIKNRVG